MTHPAIKDSKDRFDKWLNLYMNGVKRSQSDENNFILVIIWMTEAIRGLQVGNREDAIKYATEARNWIDNFILSLK